MYFFGILAQISTGIVALTGTMIVFKIQLMNTNILNIRNYLASMKNENNNLILKDFHTQMSKNNWSNNWFLTWCKLQIENKLATDEFKLHTSTFEEQLSKEKVLNNNFKRLLCLSLLIISFSVFFISISSYFENWNGIAFFSFGTSLILLFYGYKSFQTIIGLLD